jgi:hypothetical protein
MTLVQLVQRKAHADRLPPDGWRYFEDEVPCLELTT